MTIWQKTKERDPAMFNWLVSNGWTAARYNALEKWQQNDLRVEATGGLDETSFMTLWGRAAAEVTRGYGDAITDAATATGRTIRTTTIIGGVMLIGILAVVYNKELKQLTQAKR